MWSYLTAPSIHAMEFADLNLDGIMDIVVCCSATCDGLAFEDGTDDCHSYVIGLSAKGGLLWRFEAGDKYTCCKPIITDIDNDGKQDILILLITQFYIKSGYRREYGNIFRLTLDGRMVAKYDSEFILWDFTTGDLDRDGQKEIITCNRKGDIIVLDNRLNITRQRNIRPLRFDSIWMDCLSINDFNGDGKNELICRQAENEIVLLDNHGYADKPHNNVIYYDASIVLLNNELQQVAVKVIKKKETVGFQGPPYFRVETIDFLGLGRPQIIVVGSTIDIYEYRKAFLSDIVNLISF